MLQEAVRRGLADAMLADAHSLPFASASFDGAWADRTFQHLADPAAALGEMARVVRPGGRLVVADPDYGRQSVDVPDQDLARRVLGFRAGHAIRNATLAHRMGWLFADVGIVDVRSEEAPIVVRDPTALDNALGLRDWARFAHERGLVDGGEVEAWERALDEAAAAGRFRYSFSIFITAGRRP
jgi:SAM-dependent methyltransferase